MKYTVDSFFITKFQEYEDEMKRLIPLCPVKDGQAIYHSSMLKWRTKWLIIQDKMSALK